MENYTYTYTFVKLNPNLSSWLVSLYNHQQKLYPLTAHCEFKILTCVQWYVLVSAHGEIFRADKFALFGREWKCDSIYIWSEQEGDSRCRLHSLQFGFTTYIELYSYIWICRALCSTISAIFHLNIHILIFSQINTFLL